VLAEARRIRLEFFGQVLHDWSDADVEALASLIDRLNTSIRQVAG
jgi:hypothetical protein